MSEDILAPTEGAQESAVEALVGEGKKFKTVEDLAKGKLESDAFIEQLQEENRQALEALKELQGQQEDSATVSDLLQAVQEAQNKESAAQPGVSQDDLTQLVRKTLESQEAERTAAANRKQSIDLILEKTGGDEAAARQFVAEKARLLGMQPDALATLSETAPAAFAELVGLTNKAAPQKGVVQLQGSNASALQNASTSEIVDGHRTKAYYDRVKKEMGTYKFLNDRKLQKAYMDDAMALGVEKFHNT